MIRTLLIACFCLSSISNIELKDILNHYQIQTHKINYQIVNSATDNRGLINTLDVYIIKMSDIKELNQILLKKYRVAGLMSLQIFYFDNKQIAISYDRKIFDKNISDSEIDRLSQHVIGKFEWDAVSNSSTLHIGKEADTY